MWESPGPRPRLPARRRGARAPDRAPRRPRLDRARELGFRAATSAYNTACAYSMQNRVDDALAALEEAIELGFRHGDLDHDSDLDNLRQDPRFRSLRLKMQLERRG